ncbi:MAG: hypothetical protein HYT76_02735 [Deltaproteobacteria bacterium]|nr:hypothetical protein [Deltaproteobacteria bacterium]
MGDTSRAFKVFESSDCVSVGGSLYSQIVCKNESARILFGPGGKAQGAVVQRDTTITDPMGVTLEQAQTQFISPDGEVIVVAGDGRSITFDLRRAVSFVREPLEGVPQPPAVVLAAKDHPRFRDGVRDATRAYRLEKVVDPVGKRMERVSECEESRDPYSCGAAMAHYEALKSSAQDDAAWRLLGLGAVGSC